MKITLFLLLMTSFVIAHASPVWVAVQKTVVRENASYLSAVVERVKYQDKLELIDDKADWWRVQSGDIQGWVHKSALSKTLEVTQDKTKDVETNLLSMFSKKSSASKSKNAKNENRDTNDITLAGKGFNRDVEGQFKGQGAALNYAAVDVMENREIAKFNLNRFADLGGLNYTIEQPSSDNEEEDAEENENDEKKPWGRFFK